MPSQIWQAIGRLHVHDIPSGCMEIMNSRVIINKINNDNGRTSQKEPIFHVTRIHVIISQYNFKTLLSLLSVDDDYAVRKP